MSLSRFFLYPVTKNWGGSLNSSSTESFFRHTSHWIRTRAAPSHHLWDRIGIYRVLQYLDFNDAVRERDDFRSMVRENIQDLKRRQLIDWLELDRLWRDHQDKKCDIGMELMLLTALEISLKVEDEIISSV